MENIIEISHLHKEFKEVVAVKDLSFKVNANGDPTQGSCTISNGTPTFTPKA